MSIHFSLLSELPNYSEGRHLATLLTSQKGNFLLPNTLTRNYTIHIMNAENLCKRDITQVREMEIESRPKKRKGDYQLQWLLSGDLVKTREREITGPSRKCLKTWPHFFPSSHPLFKLCEHHPKKNNSSNKSSVFFLKRNCLKLISNVKLWGLGGFEICLLSSLKF